MANTIRRILVAVRDLDHSPGPALRKAAMLAHSGGARIELFHAVDAAIPAPSLQWDFAGDAVREYMQQTSDRAQRRLRRMQASPALQGLRVSCHVDWDYPVHEAIVRRALEIRADLVILSIHSRGLAKRLLLQNTDWELIRQCPCPLLLVKSPREYEKPVIIAAVDPFHTHAKPADLDARLLAYGRSVSQLLGGSLHVFHSYMPLVSFVPTPAGPVVPLGPSPEAEQAHGEFIAREFDRLAKSAGIAPAARHLHMGPVSTELDAAVKSLRASIVVVGAISRSAIRRAFIGNTAERVLDTLRCDLLVVKPRGFKTSVERRAVERAPLRSR